MFALALVLAGLIGASLGILGSGGSIVTLPVLVYVAGVPVAEAVVMSLMIVGATSLLGAAMSYRRGDVDLGTTALFGATGMAGAVLGSPLTHMVPPALLMLLFATLMLVIGGRMLWQGRAGVRRVEAEALSDVRRDGAAGRRRYPAVRVALMGLAVGVLTGFLGVGGGFLIVPALTLWAGLSVRKAMGSSLAVIALNSVAGLVGHAAELGGNWGIVGPFLVVALLGMLASHQFAGRLSDKALRLTFGWSVVAVGSVLLIVNLGAAMLAV